MINTLLSALHALKHQPYVAAPDWKGEDAAALRAFLSTTTGKRFSAALLNQALQASSSAVGSRDDRDYACGYAFGFKGALGGIQALAGTLSETTESGSTDVLDHLSP